MSYLQMTNDPWIGLFLSGQTRVLLRSGRTAHCFGGAPVAIFKKTLEEFARRMTRKFFLKFNALRAFEPSQMLLAKPDQFLFQLRARIGAPVFLLKINQLLFSDRYLWRLQQKSPGIQPGHCFLI
jgi:hypothetical protein